jgi:hypothetical protein
MGHGRKRGISKTANGPAAYRLIGLPRQDQARSLRVRHLANVPQLSKLLVLVLCPPYLSGVLE